jgi:hypothetical protein
MKEKILGHPMLAPFIKKLRGPAFMAEYATHDYEEELAKAPEEVRRAFTFVNEYCEGTGLRATFVMPQFCLTGELKTEGLD